MVVWGGSGWNQSCNSCRLERKLVFVGYQLLPSAGQRRRRDCELSGSGADKAHRCLNRGLEMSDVDKIVDALNGLRMAIVMLPITTGFMAIAVVGLTRHLSPRSP